MSASSLLLLGFVKQKNSAWQVLIDFNQIVHSLLLSQVFFAVKNSGLNQHDINATPVWVKTPVQSLPVTLSQTLSFTSLHATTHFCLLPLIERRSFAGTLDSFRRASIQPESIAHVVE